MSINFSRPTSLLLIIGAVSFIGYLALRHTSNTTVLGADWEENGLVRIEDFDHSIWDTLVRKYVDQNGLVNYRNWQSNSEDCRRLNDYLEKLSRVSVTARVDDEASAKAVDYRIAFWINAYNALTIRGILDVYPTSSIRRHVNPVGFNIWQHMKVMVNGRAYSLADIEHKVLRKNDEPRVHFALVDASVGCPRLLNQAYTGQNLDSLLAENTSHFFSLPQNLRVEGDRRIHLSSIFRWFAADFGPDSVNQRKTIASFVEDQTVSQLLVNSDTEISFVPYDWSLNEQK